jgi:drug/metabolite transporter (DMT)-like permease
MLALAPWVPAGGSPLSAQDLLLLGMLGVVCTALAHTLFITSLRTIPAGIAAVTRALEPVYGILPAALLLGEFPPLRTLSGGAVVLAAVL